MHYQIPSFAPLRWPGTGRTRVKIHSPNDGMLIGEVEQLTDADVSWLAQRILRGQQVITQTTPRERAHWLRALAQLIRDQKVQLTSLIATEGGKPFKDAEIEVDRAGQTFELCAEEATRIGGEVLPLARTSSGEHKLAFTVRGPIGPVLALSAFNHPLNLLAHQVGTALAAGCAVVFKPSRNTPYCGEWLAHALEAVGVPLEVATVCHAEVAQIQQLVSRPEFQFVSFIGSAKVGWELRSRLAPGTRLALEHGGQAAALVWDDADLDLAVKALVRGAFYHAGQVCISTQKIFVHAAIAQEFNQRLARAAAKLVTGDAREPSTDVGPLIRPEEKQRIHRWVQEALAHGASISHGVLDPDGGNFMRPLILQDVPAHCQLWREEVFGPVVCVKTFTDAPTMYQDVAQSPYHFAAAVFTQSLPRALEAVKELAAMSVVVNEATTFRVDAMPFGGHQQAGLGMGGVRYSIEELTRLKQVTIAGF